ncbi:unnamed protein product [Cuscuta campestris]|uniref:Uncharacterized protein n=1 Tax=Cuscuta campestris TaxID=132261 RepID=A0A484MBC4_9ASTE|nr:unnamed protein product [Cuscuta campestris]
MKKKLHLPNSGIDIRKLSSKNLDWNTIGISGQIPSGPAKKADLKNDYKLVLELVIACLECGSGGHADDITQERAFIINALITKTLGENRTSSVAEDEGSSDNFLIVSLKKSSKMKQVVSPSSSAEETQKLGLVNLDEEEEVSALGELQKKKKRRISSPSTSGNVVLDNSEQNQPQNSPQDLNEETYQDQSLPSPSSQDLADEVNKFMQLYYVWRAWKILDEEWVWQKTNEDLLLEHLTTSPPSEFDVDDDYTAVYTPMFINSADVARDLLSQEISNYGNVETEEESVKTLKIDEEDAEQGEDDESLPLQLYHRVPSSTQVTNFHSHSSSTSMFPNEMPES